MSVNYFDLNQASIKKFLIGTLILLITLEILLRLTGSFQVYSEKIGGEYSSYWGFSHPNYYMTLPRSKRIYYEQKEFTVDFISNSMGMRNPEVPETAPETVYRILCLGDSYTEGDGSPWGYSYPRQLERILNERSDGITFFEVINAGKNGSDIIYAQKFFTDILHQFNPDLVLMSINDSDIDDIIQRGGKERFRPNNSTVYKDGPWYEGLYARSYAFRFIIHVPMLKNQLFLGPRSAKKRGKESVDIISSSMKDMQAFCDAKGIAIRFIIQPLPWHVNAGKFKCINKNPDDLNSCFHKASLLSGLPPDQLSASYNLYPPMMDAFRDKQYDEYAWKLNGHFNSYGYGILAEELFKLLAKDQHLEN